MAFSLMVSKQRALKSWKPKSWGSTGMNIGADDACESSWSCGGSQWSIPLRVPMDRVHPSQGLVTAVTAKEEAGEGSCATATTILTTNHLFWNASDDQINCQGNLRELRALVILDYPRNNDMLTTW